MAILRPLLKFPFLFSLLKNTNHIKTPISYTDAKRQGIHKMVSNLFINFSL